MLNYELGKYIAKGKFGEVFQCKKKDEKEILAIKIISKTQIKKYDIESQIDTEIKILSMIDHDNIIHLVDNCEDDKNIYIITNYINGNDLYNTIIKNSIKLDEKIISNYILQLANAIEYLHKFNIIHRDIKPENIILSNTNKIVLCDFGWAAISNHINEKHTLLCGTLDYLCPEIVDSEGHDYRCDIWDIGVLTYELLAFLPPFAARTYKDTYNNISNVTYICPDYFSDNVKDFIDNILVKNPNNRMSIDQIKNHPWITRNIY